MKQLSDKHPKPDAPLYTILLSEDYDIADAKYFHMIARNRKDPDSVDVIHVFDEQKRFIALQTELKPRVETPPMSAITDIEGKSTIYNLTLPASFPEFPKYGNLTKVLHSNNSEG